MYSEYAIISAFPQQKWLHERASVLHLYVHCPSVLHVHLCMELQHYLDMIVTSSNHATVSFLLSTYYASMAMVSTQPLTEMSTRSISWG